jgi:hypothetical protein
VVLRKLTVLLSALAMMGVMAVPAFARPSDTPGEGPPTTEQGNPGEPGFAQEDFPGEKDEKPGQTSGPFGGPGPGSACTGFDEAFPNTHFVCGPVPE